jgi:hypothetical protein
MPAAGSDPEWGFAPEADTPQKLRLWHQENQHCRTYEARPADTSLISQSHSALVELRHAMLRRKSAMHFGMPGTQT